MAELAARQHGVVSRPQLLSLGYSSATIARGVETGRLHPLYRGAYAVGHPAVTQHGRCLAAVLASGSGALLSHQSSAWLWGLSAQFPAEPNITTPARGHTKPGVRVHHSTILEEVDRAVCGRVPATAVPRTLLDLAANVKHRFLVNAVERAERLDLLDLGAIDDLLGRGGRHRGIARLRRALDIYRDRSFTRSLQERLLLDLVKRAGLPRPAMNTFVAGYEIDAYWEAERFAVEVDGWESHRSRMAFERDPLRQEDLKLAGIDSIRLTARRIEREPDLVAERLRRLLDQRRKQVERERTEG